MAVEPTADKEQSEADLPGNVVGIRRTDPRGSMIANRTPWIPLPEPFDNLEIRAWLDYPKEIADLWAPKKDETEQQIERRMLEACKNTFLDHRGRETLEPWEDEEGPLPGTDTDEFWKRISTPLGAKIVTSFFEEMAGNRPSRVSRRKMKRR